MTQQVEGGEALDRMYEALAAGDVEGALACLTPDAKVWHSFDGVVHERDSIRRDWEGFVSNTSERSTFDVRRQPTSTGFVQQHVGVFGMGGKRMAWSICLVVEVRDGLIARINEYIDRGGSWDAGEGPVTNRGF